MAQLIVIKSNKKLRFARSIPARDAIRWFITAAIICKVMVGASMAVHFAGQPVIVTARGKPAGTVIATLPIAGQGIMRMASCLTRICFDMRVMRIVASLQRVLTVRGSQEARMALTACALCHAVGTETEPAI